MPTHPGATIPQTEVWSLASQKARRAYRISVALPYSYESNPKKRYPVIYLLDANMYFGLVSEQTRSMALCRHIPETIVVGIGYALSENLEQAFKEWAVLRWKDLTPAMDSALAAQVSKWMKVKRLDMGGSKRFLQCIETELIPQIESRYRASPAGRVLAGHSFGGLFTVYALLQPPQLFSGYVAGSPSLSYGARACFKYEKKFAKSHKALPVKLYIGVGSSEESPSDTMVSDAVQFIAQLERRKYEGLSLTKQIVENCGHCASPAPTFQAGLQAVLN